MAIPFGGGLDYTLIFEHGQMLADNRLGLFKTLPEVGNTGVLLFNEAEYFQA